MSVDADALREDWLDPELPKHMHAGSSYVYVNDNWMPKTSYIIPFVLE